MKIAICGGTFDPFHRGHLDPVLAVRHELQWSTIIYIPAWRQPFKPHQKMVSGYHRFAMAVLATQMFDDVFVSPRELDRGAISYSVDTLEELRGEYPAATLDWVIGDDNLEQLGSWKRIDRIFELANFVVLTRREWSDSDLAVRAAAAGGVAAAAGRVTAARDRGKCGNIVLAANSMVPVSSTEIRKRLRSGESIAELVDPHVSRYIEQYRLYQEVQT